MQMSARRHRRQIGLGRSTVHGVVFAILRDRPSCCLQISHAPFLIPRCSETVIVAVQIFVAFSLNFY
jgi:hypothetical protein